MRVTIGISAQPSFGPWFFPLASVYWALLPLLARQQIGGGPELYGILLGAIGTGAVAGAFVLPARVSMITEGPIVGIEDHLLRLARIDG